MARALGLFGKIPARGDFVSRRLDHEFVDAWDAWLQRAMAESRSRLGAAWLDAFLSAPIWRFIVPKGMFSATGWMGLVIPSVDRVGRYFPLTIATPLAEENIDLAATLVRASRWFTAIEELALDALSPQLDFEQFDLRLAATLIPDELPVIADTSDDTVPMAMSQSGFHVRQIADGTSDSVLTKDLKTELALVASPCSLWMTLGGDAVPVCVARCSGIISGRRFCAMLDGRWTEHDWTANLIMSAQVAAIEAPTDANPVLAKSADTMDKTKTADSSATVDSRPSGDAPPPLPVDLPKNKLLQSDKKIENPTASEAAIGVVGGVVAEVVAGVIDMVPKSTVKTTTADSGPTCDPSPPMVVDLPENQLQQSEKTTENPTASGAGTEMVVVDSKLDITQ